MQKLKFIKLSILVCSVFLYFDLAAQESTVVTRLDAIIKPVRTVSPDSSFEDIAFLEPILGGKEIVALGEVTHGTKEIYSYKDRLVRYLVANLNYKAIAFEADYSGMELIDHYINGKIDSTAMSPHYRPLLTWLRAYNKSKAEQDKVHVYGLEIREFSAAIDQILGTSPNIEPEDKAILLRIKSLPFDKINKGSLDNFRTVVNRLPKTLYSNLLTQLIDNYKNFTGRSSKIGARDKYMAENAIAIKESIADKKLIIWAHNGHVAKTSLYGKPAMGQFLYEKYKDGYYVVATDINKGYVRVRKLNAKNKPLSDWLPFYYPEVSSAKGYEYYFKQCKFKNFILNVHEALKDSELQSFLTTEKEMRMIGAIHVPVNKKLSIATNFDMVIYFDETNSI